VGKRVRRSLASLWAIAIALLGMFAVAVPTYSQTPQPAAIAVAKTIRTQELKHDPSRYAKNQIG
jgi:hypothetical protein